MNIDGGGGGEGGAPEWMPEWQRLGYPSYEAWLAAQQGATGTATTDATGTAAATTPSYPAGWNPLYHIGGGATQEQIDYMQNTLGMASRQTYAAQGGRVPAAYGGVMDTYTGRRAYKLGSLNPFKAVSKAVKSLTKSKAGKIGLMALLGMKGPEMLGGMGMGEGTWASLGTSIKKNPLPWILGLSGLGYATAEEEEDLYAGRDADLAKWEKQFEGLGASAKPWYAAQGGRTGYRFGKGVEDLGLEQEVRMRMEVFNEDYDTALEKVLEARAGTVSSPSGTSVMEPGSLGNQLIANTGLMSRTPPRFASIDSGMMPI